MINYLILTGAAVLISIFVFLGFRRTLDFKKRKGTVGYLYVISNPKSFGKGIYKIGYTGGGKSDCPYNRIKSLSDASVPHDFVVHAIIKLKGAYDLEQALHDYFDYERVNPKKEFFKVRLSKIKSAISKSPYKLKYIVEFNSSGKPIIGCK